MTMGISDWNGFHKLGTANGILQEIYTINEFQVSNMYVSRILLYLNKILLQLFQTNSLTTEDAPLTSFPMMLLRKLGPR